ncbi:MAG: starch-binding protein [Ruminococcaceae bacterium]|nr:starch-binding protein [Oscillospiraceae bacterium]
MKKSVFAFVSIFLILTIVMTSFTYFSISASDISADMANSEWSEETPFIRYEDAQGIRYIGAVGNITEERSYDEDAAVDIEPVGNNKSQLAAVGKDLTLPESVDLSQSEYFPPIGNQGGLGSCATFSTAYYQFSYEINRSRDVAATFENTRSPQIVYNVMSDLNNSGTYSESNYTFMKYHGAPSMAMLPYSDADNLSWHAKEEIWNEALDYRIDEFFSLDNIGIDETRITSPDDEDLAEIKSALASGSVLIYSTCIYSWVADKIVHHKDAPENDKFLGQEIVKYQDGFNGAHSMTLVGYNDNIWVDQNSNGKVETAEMGAFKIANSWGEGYANGGFCWVAYDAVNKVTAVEGGFAGNRGSAIEDVKRITVKPFGQGSKIYARFTLNTTDRVQMNVDFHSERNGIEENGKFLFGSSYRNDNNRFGFDGTKNATDGHFCYALDNVSPELCRDNFDDYVFSATFEDTDKDGQMLQVKKVEIVNEYTGKVYPMDCAPFSIDGEKKTVNLKSAETTDKTIYYIGFDEPVLNYKIGNGEFKSVKMEYSEVRHGYNYRYVIEDAPEDVTLYFTDADGKADDNGGALHKATERLNFYRTKGVREPLEVTGFEYENGLPDINKRSVFLPEIKGGYEPYNMQYTFENLDTGDVKQYAFDYRYEKSHAFYQGGKIRFTIDVMDQTGDIATYVEILDIIDRHFEFAEFTAASQYGDSIFVGENAHFNARTEFEDIISRGPFKSLYDFVIKDSDGNVCYTETKKSYAFHLTNCVSKIALDWVPQKKGDYTVTISSTDDSKDFAERTLSFSVVDRIYGDANGDGKVSIKDATALQKSLAGFSQDIQLIKFLSDCDNNNVLSIKDATCIRKYLAGLDNSFDAGKIIEYIPPVTEPETKPTEPKPTYKNVVTFTNSHNWGGTISCYYWSDSNTSMTTWPGKAMTAAGKNDYGQTLYTFNVPDGATYIIFTNGSSQTEDIAYSGGEIRYYPLTETDSKGHYKVKTW